MKMLLKVKDVPYMGKITKKTGDKQYEVRDKVVIYSENCDKPINELKALPGTRLLISTDPAYSFAIVSVPDTLEVLWEVSPNELKQYLYDMEIHQ